MFRFVQPNALFRWYYSDLIWRMPASEKKLYLTFDDGPTEVATCHVLDVLKSFQIKATFFCLGQNILKNKAVYERLISEGHLIGNHTMSHPNGWKTKDDLYLSEVEAFSNLHTTDLFRPPYGRIKKTQWKKIIRTHRIIMWDVLSYDFDTTEKKENCLSNVITHVRNGSILLFHDSPKAYHNMSYALPRSIEHCLQQGYTFELLSKEKFGGASNSTISPRGAFSAK